MTLLTASIRADDETTLRDLAHRAWNGGADAIEIRLDGFTGSTEHVRRLVSEPSKGTWIVTCRCKRQGGHSDDPPVRRAEFLASVVRGSDAYVDFELTDWEAAPEVQPLLLQAIGASAGAKPQLILSAHDFDGRPADLPDIVKRAHSAVPGAIAKIAYLANDLEAGFAAVDLMHEHGDSVIAIAMGEAGLWTRVLAKKLGAFASYCCLGDEDATAPGQLTLNGMLNAYRWRDLSAATKVFGVLGRPVAHSMSPVLLNRWFAESATDAIYLPLLAPDDEPSFVRFLEECSERPWLNMGGFSVTLPHKTTVARWVGKAGDRLVNAVGAANTLALRDGSATAFNTDCYAAVDSMLAALGCARTDLRGRPIDVLGIGGAARAILAALAELGCDVTLYGRSPARTEELAGAFSARAATWDDRIERTGQLLINCTPVGMWPNVDETPISADALDGCELVFDMIYNPLQTRLLRDAKEAGIATLNGLDMFLRQAAAQFELWTSVSPDIELGRTIVTEEIERRARQAQ